MNYKIIYFVLLFFMSSNARHFDALGKTHFIVGTSQVRASEDSIIPVQRKNVPASLPLQILFAPDNNIRDRLLQLIDRERQAIYIAIYMITDAEIVHALCQAKKRGIVVELITDVGCLKDRSSKVNQLCKQGCSIYIYNPTSLAKTRGVSLMHHKFALFANNDHGTKTWTGSYNFTRAANNVNQENVVIFSDKQVFDTFFEQFKLLKERSYRYTTSGILA